MADPFSSAATVAFDKLNALKRRYQQEPDPVPVLRADPEIAAELEGDDIPVLTQAVLIVDEPVEQIEAVEPPALPVSPAAVMPANLMSASEQAEDALIEKVIARLRPELESLIAESIQAVLDGRNPAIYQAWLNGLRQRSRELLSGDADDSASPWI